MSETPAPYGPSPPRHLRLVKPKKKHRLTPEKEKILRPLINLLKKRYEMKYLESMQRDQMKLKRSETLTGPGCDNH